MGSAEIVLIFEWDGQSVHKETSGFEGKSCVDATKFIEEALGERDGDFKPKAEYYRRDQQQQQRGGRDRLHY